MKIKKMICFMTVIVLSLGIFSSNVWAESSIVIDGYFDDWEDKPKTEVGYFFYEHDCSLIRDEENIYLFFELAKSYMASMPIDAIQITVGNDTMWTYIRYPNSNGYVDWTKPVKTYKEGIYTGLAPFTYYPTYSLGEAALEISDVGRWNQTNDRMEIKFSIEKVEQVMGLTPGTINSGATVKVSNPTLGFDEVIVVGTPIGPLGLIIPCFALAIVGFKNWKKRMVKK